MAIHMGALRKQRAERGCHLCVSASYETALLRHSLRAALGCAAGAIYANDTSNIIVLDSKFYANGGGQGGAISLWNSSLLVNGTTFYRNMGNGAGVASCIVPASFARCEVTVEDVGKLAIFCMTFCCMRLLAAAFPHCRACGRRLSQDTGLMLLRYSASKDGRAHDVTCEATAGGAIAVRNASTIQIITSAFTENQAENGGAVYLETCGKAALADNTFTSNRANKQGGGLFQTKCSGRTPQGHSIPMKCPLAQLDVAVKCCCFSSSLPPFLGLSVLWCVKGSL